MPSLVNSAMSRLQPAESAMGSATLDDPPGMENRVRNSFEGVGVVENSYRADNQRRECRIDCLLRRKLLHASATNRQSHFLENMPFPFTVTCGTLLALGTSGATPATTMVALRATDVEMTALRPFIL